MLKNILIGLLAFFAFSCVQQADKGNFSTDTISENLEIVNDSVTSMENEVVDKVENRPEEIAHFPTFPLRSEPEVFRIDQKKDTLLITNKRTEIYIPANCFTGNSGKVKLSVIEAYSKKDMLKNGFQTVSDDNLLISEGMIEVQAISGNKMLEIAKDKKIRIELPKKDIANENKIFYGNRVDNRISWQEIGEVYKEMIPIPLEYLSPRHFGIKYFSNRLYNNIQNNKVTYENSYISTDQFMDRFVAIAGLRDSSIMTDAFNMYLSNLQRPLWKVDKEIYDFLNQLDKNDYTFLTDDQVVFYQFYSKKFLKFSKEGLSFVKQYLSNKDSLYIKRYIQTKGGNAKLENAFVNSFYISKLGTYNVDRAFNVESIGGNRLVVISNFNLKYLRSFIILKNYKSIVEGYRKGEKEFRFSQEKSEAYILPVGQSATVVTIGMDENEQFYIGYQNLVIDRNPKPLTISMEKVPWNDINKVIEENIKI